MRSNLLSQYFDKLEWTTKKEKIGLNQTWNFDLILKIFPFSIVEAFSEICGVKPKKIGKKKKKKMK